MSPSFVKNGNARAAFARHEAAVSARVAAANDAVAELILTKSKTLVPVDTGALRDSGGTRSEGAGFGRRAVVFYGPADGTVRTLPSSKNSGRPVKRYPRNYAWFVHANFNGVTYKQGQADFLAAVVRDDRAELKLEFRRALGAK